MFENALQMRTVKARSFSALPHLDANVVCLKPEFVHKHPDACLQRMARAFSLPIQNRLILPDKRLGTCKCDATVAQRYEEARRMSVEDRNFILGQLDPNVGLEMGYEYS